MQDSTDLILDRIKEDSKQKSGAKRLQHVLICMVRSAGQSSFER